MRSLPASSFRSVREAAPPHRPRSRSRSLGRRAALLAGAAALLAAWATSPPRPAWADGGAAPAARPAEKTKVALEGALACVGCHLEARHGPIDAQCTLHSKHAQGFVEAGTGKLYTLLDNARGHLLAHDRALGGKPIRLEAWAFPDAQVLAVLRYAVKDGERWAQQDYCRFCGFEPGDNGGRDVCADCEE